MRATPRLQVPSFITRGLSPFLLGGLVWLSAITAASADAVWEGYTVAGRQEGVALHFTPLSGEPVVAPVYAPPAYFWTPPVPVARSPLYLGAPGLIIPRPSPGPVGSSYFLPALPPGSGIPLYPLLLPGWP